uniref:NADH dehydrogenase subunit 6 n=1 Tax=Protaeolidiella atra TaxID=1154746 RepID=A0A7S6VHG8_9GAST|nr:NADH dehydrogenase subunit 6 [Protaeolidiella atra]QOW38668.1 NADH dehydrogenase subunit 6 [Protaeolidiella atra]
MFFSFLFFLILSFSVFYSPVNLIGILLSISLLSTLVLSLFGSFWYSYILFLVYVGGLLVLFIYICLVSSNFFISIDLNMIMVMFSSAVVTFSFNLNFPYPKLFLGLSGSSCGASLLEESNISIFMFLVVLLLMMLLVVVRVSGAGSAIVSNEKS